MTQFLSVCKCELESSEFLEETPVKICAHCGKRIDDGREGTITQFIFRAESCRCEEPEPVWSDSKRPFKAQAFEGFLENQEEEVELDIADTSFPKKRYKPIKELGRGASGTVYLARDLMLTKKVAIKTLHYLDGEQLIQFQEEARATSKLSHPNIIQILDFGCTSEGLPYMVLEYFKGKSLEEILKEKGRLNWDEASRIVSRICNGISYANERNIFHRDLKPSNILVSETNVDSIDVKLIDFGVAKVFEMLGKTTEFQGKTLAGTPSYMSPDVFRGFTYSSASEVYSLGCVFYECLTGHPPFEAETSLETLSMHANHEPPSMQDIEGVNIPANVESVILKCLEKDPENRYQQANELLEALEKIQFDDTPREQANVETESEQKNRQPKWISMLMVSIAGITFVGLFCFFVSNLLFKDPGKIASSTDKNVSEEIKDSSMFRIQSWMTAGSKAREQGDFEEAEIQFGNVLSVSPKNTVALYDRAYARFHLGKYEDSISDTNQVLRLNPDNYLAYGLLGMNYRKLGRIEKAHSCYDKAIEINPNYERAYFMKGNIYIADDQYQKAIDWYEKANFAPHDNLYSLYMLNKATAYHYLKSTPKALSIIDEALDNGANIKQLYHDKAVMLFETGKLKEAYAALDEGQKHFPKFKEFQAMRKQFARMTKKKKLKLY